MRIKVVRVKNKSNYTVKAVLTVIVVAIVFKYYCGHKNVNAIHFLNSSKYKEIMGTEISLMSYVAKQSNSIKPGKKQEVVGFIDNEISVIKEVNSHSFTNNTNIDDNENEESQEKELTEETAENSGSETANVVQEAFLEPETRLANRSTGFVCF